MNLPMTVPPSSHSKQETVDGQFEIPTQSRSIRFTVQFRGCANSNVRGCIRLQCSLEY